MKNLSILILLTLITTQYLFDFQIRDSKTNSTDSTSTLTISFVGDLMCHSPQMDYARIGKDSFDFKPVFRKVKNYLSSADITIGNLETIFAGTENGYSGYPLFNSPDEYLYALKDAGFDILLTANNHSMDRGKKGIIRTIEKINSLGMSSIGSFKSQYDRDSIRVFEINGIKITLLAYTYGLNGNYIPKNEKYLVNKIDTNLIKLDIEDARKKNADVVLVYFHFGEEYQRKLNTYQKEIVKSAVNSGADLIIGSHPHVIQPIEKFLSEKNKIKEGIIAYSLGNFLSNQRWRYSDTGVILNMTIKKNISTGQIRLSKVSFLPTWVYKGKIDGKNEFVILPADTTLSDFHNQLPQTDRLKLFQSIDDTRKMFSSTSNQSNLYTNQNAQ